MKINSIVILLLLFSISGFSQKEPCEDRIDSAKKTTLNTAKLMSDLIPNYPTEEYNKMIDYVSVEIVACCNGNSVSAKSGTDALTTEQKNILKTADIGTRIYLKIKFKYKDPENDNLGSGRKIKEMEFRVKASTLPLKGLPPCGC